jgi:hypothetical protein
VTITQSLPFTWHTQTSQYNSKELFKTKYFTAYPNETTKKKGRTAGEKGREDGLQDHEEEWNGKDTKQEPKWSI